MKRIILVYLKINTIRNKCGLVIDHITVDVDVMVISVTKLDEPCLLEVPGHALPFRICQWYFGFYKRRYSIKLISLN